MKVTLCKVFRGEQETKYGMKPKMAIKTEQHGDKWLSTFKVQGTEKWNIGDEVEINVTENGQYLNFEPVNNDNIAVTLQDFQGLVERVEALERATVTDEPPF